MSRWCSSVSVNCRSIDSTGLSDVIGSWKIMPMSRPRTLRISWSDSANKSLPSKRMLPPTILARGIGNEPQDRHRADGLAATRFTDDGHGLARSHVIGDAVDRFDDTGGCKELCLEIFNLEKLRHKLPFARVCRASLVDLPPVGSHFFPPCQWPAKSSLFSTRARIARMREIRQCCKW